MARLSIKKPDAKFYRGWGFVALLTIALTIAVFASRGGFETVGSGLSDPSGCRVEVIGDTLNVRTEPSVTAPIAETLRRGDLRPAQKLTLNGFRKLADNRWASEQFLRTVPGANCG